MRNFFANLYKSLLGGLVSRQLSRPTGLLSAKVGKEMNLSNENLYRQIIAQSTFANHTNMLEIGFGNGHFFSDMLKANNKLKISGVEMSKAMIVQAKQWNKVFLKEDKLQLLHQQATGLPFLENSFQAVVAINLVYFWKDVSFEISEIHRCLQPGGLIYVGMRPHHILKGLPFVGKEFNLQPESWWIGQFEGNGFSHESSQTFTEPETIFGGQSLPMAGTVLIFKKR